MNNRIVSIDYISAVTHAITIVNQMEILVYGSVEYRLIISTYPQASRYQ